MPTAHVSTKDPGLRVLPVSQNTSLTSRSMRLLNQPAVRLLA